MTRTLLFLAAIGWVAVAPSPKNACPYFPSRVGEACVFEGRSGGAADNLAEATTAPVGDTASAGDGSTPLGSDSAMPS